MHEKQIDIASTPFDTIESAQEFITLLQSEIHSAREEIGRLINDCDDASRRAEALKLVQYKLSILESHVDASQRVLHDLRTLRRLLLGSLE
jgi:FtsZ-binding cell division protein ZapB